ncbi:uncharacterized protein METZ01_LOCUS510464 [marine metagenome]|uniref:Uncharacterized protein n=1 Tax=marine metagenome TaxID=408172 RepID=A0A383EMR5_9ZZZZ
MGCDENSTNEQNACSECIEVYTSDWSEAPFYYNLVTNEEDVTDWHISLQKIEVPLGDNTYPMPSIIMNSNVFISIYNELSFNDITTTPDEIEWSAESLTSYKNEYEVLHYPGTCEISSHNHPPGDHKIQVSNYNYLIKETSTNNIYKLHFEVYVSGIVMFKLSQLNIED